MKLKLKSLKSLKGSSFKRAWHDVRFRKGEKSLRRKLGLTSESRWVREIRKNLKSGSVVSPSMPYSASSYQYVHNPRTLSQMTGGV